MKQTKNVLKDKVEYLGRLVDKLTFRAFVYNRDGSQRLAKSWNEFQELVAGGVWFAQKVEQLIEDAPTKEELVKEAVEVIADAILPDEPKERVIQEAPVEGQVPKEKIEAAVKTVSRKR